MVKENVKKRYITTQAKVGQKLESKESGAFGSEELGCCVVPYQESIHVNRS